MIRPFQAREEFAEIIDAWISEFEEKYQKTLSEIEHCIHQANLKSEKRECEYVYNDCDPTYFPDNQNLKKYLREIGYSVRELTDDEKYDDKCHIIISWET